MFKIYMTNNTDNLIQEFADLGCLPTDAQKYANLYITRETFNDYPDNEQCLDDLADLFEPIPDGDRGTDIVINNNNVNNLPVKNNNKKVLLRLRQTMLTKLKKKIATKQKNNKKATHKIGSDFGDCIFVEEYEDEMIYIPPPDHCFLRCYEKLYNILSNGTDILLTRKGIKPFGNNLISLRSIIDESSDLLNIITEDKIPDVIKVSYSDERKKTDLSYLFRKIDKTAKNNNGHKMKDVSHR